MRGPCILPVTFPQRTARAKFIAEQALNEAEDALKAIDESSSSSEEDSEEDEDGDEDGSAGKEETPRGADDNNARRHSVEMERQIASHQTVDPRLRQGSRLRGFAAAALMHSRVKPDAGVSANKGTVDAAPVSAVAPRIVTSQKNGRKSQGP